MTWTLIWKKYLPSTNKSIDVNWTEQTLKRCDKKTEMILILFHFIRNFLQYYSYWVVLNKLYKLNYHSKIRPITIINKYYFLLYLSVLEYQKTKVKKIEHELKSPAGNRIPFALLNVRKPGHRSQRQFLQAPTENYHKSIQCRAAGRIHVQQVAKKTHLHLEDM